MSVPRPMCLAFAVVTGTVLALVLAGSAAAVVNVTQNIAFTANGKNPWGSGNAIEFAPPPITLLDIPYTHVDIPPINADPTGILLDTLRNALGIPLPDLVKLQVGGSASGSAHIGAELYASLGRLNINYPASAGLNLQTIGGGDYVLANQSYAIGSTFSPGVTQLDVPIAHAITVGGPGYGDTALFGGLTFTTYSTPKFATTAPWAEAKLVATADVKGGVFTKLSALGGLKEWRKDFKFGGPVGGPIVEIDPSGLYVFGEDTGLFSLTQPINIPIAGVGTATVTYPNLAVSGGPSAPGSQVLFGTNASEVFRIDTDLEKLVPVLGPVLHNSLGPFTYDILHLGLAPTISLYQDMTLTPDPQVRLTFSETVRVDDQETRVVERPLGTPINWEPMFSNSDEITIVPEFILKNAFRSITGIDVSLEIDLDAIGIKLPVLDYIGPLIDPPPYSQTLLRVPLLQPAPWEIELGVVTGKQITIPKSNIDIQFGFGDLGLDAAIYLSGDPGQAGVAVPQVRRLQFSRTVDGGPPQMFEVDAPGLFSFTDWADGVQSHYFQAQDDVVLTDPNTQEQFSVGRNFCIGSCDLSDLLPAPGQAFIVEDPNNPGQFLPPLYVPTLPDIPNTDVDVVNHPILGQHDPSNMADVTEVEFGTEVVDLRDQPFTTILARTRELTPDRPGEFGPFNAISMNEQGDVAFLSTLNALTNSTGYYFANESEKANFFRSGDPAPGGGGTLQVFNTNGWTVNSLGQAAFVMGISGSFSNSIVLRGGPDGLELIARDGQTAPAGNGTFLGFGGPVLNELGQVAFWTRVTHPILGTDEVIYIGDGSTLTEVARQGDAAPGMPGLMDSFGYYSLNNSGQVAFDVYTTGNVQGLYVHDGNGLNLIASDGGAVPGGGEFVGINDQHLNNVGQVAFAAGLRAFPGANLEFGIFRGDADGQSLVQIAREGQLAPDGDGTLKNNLFSFQLNDAGQVAIHGQVDAATDYRVILLGDGGPLTQIARNGMTAPDGNGQFTGFSGLPRINNQGHVAFNGVVSDNPGDDDELGVYLYDGTSLVQVVRTGQPLGGSTVTSADLAGINDDMQVAYRANLADGRVLIARVEPHLYWRNAGSGDWGTDQNWSLGFAPRQPYDVFIIAENALTVDGPFGNRTVKSLTLGADDSATVTLELFGGITLTAINGTMIRPNGVLAGYGALAGNVTSSGTIRVGDSGAAAITTMALNGDIVLEASSKLEMDIHSTSLIDQLGITGTATLGGELAAFLLGVVPVLGNSFEILTATAGVSGQFDMTVTDLPDLASGLGWLIDYDANSVVLQVVVETPGDFSSNGVVGPEDYAVWYANFGSTTNNSADANGDGIVDAADFTVWRDHLGQALGSGSGIAGSASAYATVPEPTTIVGLLSALLAAATLMPIRRR